MNGYAHSVQTVYYVFGSVTDSQEWQIVPNAESGKKGLVGLRQLEGRRSAKLSYSRLLFKYTYWRDPLQSPRSAILRTSQNAAMHIS